MIMKENNLREGIFDAKIVGSTCYKGTYNSFTCTPQPIWIFNLYHINPSLDDADSKERRLKRFQAMLSSSSFIEDPRKCEQDASETVLKNK